MPRLAILVAFVLCAVALPAVAQAGGSPSQPPASIDQYVEQLPTATGHKAAGSQGKLQVPNSQTTSTQTTTTTRTQTSKTETKQNRASSPLTTTSRPPTPPARHTQDGGVKNASVGGGAAAAANAVSSASDSRIIGVAIALLLLSIAGLGAAVVRHRRNAG